MSAHITQDEMTELLMGTRTSTLDCHLQACAECREELERVKSSLALFRTASHAWSESLGSEVSEMQPVLSLPRARRIHASWGEASWWKLAAVAAVLLIVFAAAYRIKRTSVNDNTAKGTTPNAVVAESSQNQIAQDQIAQDNELLAQVNSEISESVPTPMQPLQISAASSNSSSQNTK
jgi:predicted anti-sigma-YlaC factor YlaD